MGDGGSGTRGRTLTVRRRAAAVAGGVAPTAGFAAGLGTPQAPGLVEKVGAGLPNEAYRVAVGIEETHGLPGSRRHPPCGGAL